uniref:Uncharacterized protein n=1 Tax=Arion vulgaris TaxID=1028688 RepID=A0A0B7BP21_9EUPU
MFMYKIPSLISSNNVGKKLISFILTALKNVKLKAEDDFMVQETDSRLIQYWS